MWAFPRAGMGSGLAREQEHRLQERVARAGVAHGFCCHAHLALSQMSAWVRWWMRDPSWAWRAWKLLCKLMLCLMLSLLLTIGRRYSASSFAPLPGDKEARTSEAWSTAAPWKGGGGGQERTGVALSR